MTLSSPMRLLAYFSTTKGCNRIIIMKMWDVLNNDTPSEKMIADLKSSRRGGCLNLEMVIPRG